jgi:hypothetical protein
VKDFVKMGCFQEKNRECEPCEDLQTAENSSSATIEFSDSQQNGSSQTRSPANVADASRNDGTCRKSAPKNSMLDLRIRPCRSIRHEITQDSCHQTLTEQVEVMTHRENAVYAKEDFLDGLEEDASHAGLTKRTQMYVFRPGFVEQVVLLNEKETSKSRHEAIDPTSREQMTLWVFRIVDHFGLPREFGTICMSYIDRFLAVYDCDKNVFKLACMTCIYMTTKIHGVSREMILPRCLENLSRGEFNVKDVKAMEAALLPALKWQVNPPTAYSFVRICGAFFSESTSMHVRDAMLNIACFLTDLAICDYALICHKQSDVAGASLLLAASMASKSVFSQDERSHLYDAVFQLFGTRKQAENTKALTSRLSELYKRSEQYRLCDVSHREEDVTSSDRQMKARRDSSSVLTSPSCVSVLRPKAVCESFRDA